MNSKVIMLIVLFALLPIVIWYSFFRKDPRLANYQVPNTAGTPTASPATSAAGGAAGTATTPVADQGRFAQVDINIEELKEAVSQVDFDYMVQRMPRNPMAPLVGSRSPQRLTADGGVVEGSEHIATGAELTLLANSMRLTGILMSANKPVAILENEVVTEGYTFPSGVTVDTIEPGRVLVRVGSVVIPIELKER